MKNLIFIVTLLVSTMASGETPRIPGLDSALAKQHYEIILGELLGKPPPSITTEDLADEYKWLLRHAEQEQHIPLYCVLAERVVNLSPDLARRWYARCRTGVSLIAQECTTNPRSPWIVVVDGLPNAQAMKADQTKWHQATTEALTLALNRSNRPSAKWFCGTDNILPQDAAEQARETAIQALLSKDTQQKSERP